MLYVSIVVQERADEVIDTLSNYDPLIGVIATLLIVAVSTLAGVVLYLFRLYHKEARSKDKQIEELNQFIRTSYQESTAIINDMVRVLDVLTRKTDDLNEDVRAEIQNFLMEMRTHLTTLLNMPDFKRAAKKREINGK